MHIRLTRAIVLGFSLAAVGESAAQVITNPSPAPLANVAYGATLDLHFFEPPGRFPPEAERSSPWKRQIGGALTAIGRWPMRARDPANTGHTSALGPVEGRLAWRLNKACDSCWVWRPAVAPDGTIYVNILRVPAAGVDGDLVALNPDGSEKWKVKLKNAAGQGVWTSATPIIDGQGNIYVAWAHVRDFGGPVCMSFDAEGNLRWRFENKVEFAVASHQEPVLHDGVLYLANDTRFRINDPTHRARLWALDAATGEPLWDLPSSHLDTFFDRPTVGADGAIYQVSAANGLRGSPGYLYRVKPDGIVDWDVEVGAGTNNPPTLDSKGDVYIADLAGVAHKFSPGGEKLWSYDTESGRIFNAPVLHGEHVLLGSANKGLHIVDAATGKRRAVHEDSSYPMGKSSDGAGDAFFYTFDVDGSVFAYGERGRRWWSAQTGLGVSVNASVVANNGLLLISNAHSLSAYFGTTLGDMNCDGSLDLPDVEPFILSLLDPDEYAAKYPDCDLRFGDINGDGSVDLVDVEAFIEVLLEG